MSNRTEAEITYAAALKAAHVLQIEALTAPGLTDMERIERFAKAARFTPEQLRMMTGGCGCSACAQNTVASRVWREGDAPYSLFGNLPGCECPVIEVDYGRADFPGIPRRIPSNWSPTVETLEAFARVQQENRLK